MATIPSCYYTKALAATAGAQARQPGAQGRQPTVVGSVSGSVTFEAAPQLGRIQETSLCSHLPATLQGSSAASYLPKYLCIETREEKSSLQPFLNIP